MLAVLKDVLDKKEKLLSLKEQVEKLVPKVLSVTPKVIPDFAQYGWGRLEHFVPRLQQACDEPLVEEGRDLLASVGVIVDPQVLRAGAATQGTKFLRTASEIKLALESIGDASARSAAARQVERLLRSDEWEDARNLANEWKEAYAGLLVAANEAPTRLRRLVMQTLTDEGPEGAVTPRYRALREMVFAVGGKKLWSVADRETTDGLHSLESRVKDLADHKSTLEQVIGRPCVVGVPPGQRASLDSVRKSVLQQVEGARAALTNRTASVREMAAKVSNLATLAGENEEQPVDLNSMAEAEQHLNYLERRLQQLADQVRQMMSGDAIDLLEAVAGGQLPPGWDDHRITEALLEIVRGYRLRVEVKGA